jgi:hypothetical protein
LLSFHSTGATFYNWAELARTSMLLMVALRMIDWDLFPNKS